MSCDRRSTQLRMTVFTAITAALICIAAPFTIPLPSAVPLSLATFAVYISGALLGSIRGTLAVAVYLLIGLVGLPVYSGFTGGPAVIAGVTGGFLIGYLPCAFITGLFTEKSCAKPALMAVGMAAGTATLYIIGTVWFMIFTGSDLSAALLGCVVPFLAGDTVKIAAACAVSVVLRKKLRPMMTEKNST